MVTVDIKQVRKLMGRSVKVEYQGGTKISKVVAFSKVVKHKGEEITLNIYLNANHFRDVTQMVERAKQSLEEHKECLKKPYKTLPKSAQEYMQGLNF